MQLYYIIKIQASTLGQMLKIYSVERTDYLGFCTTSFQSVVYVVYTR